MIKTISEIIETIYPKRSDIHSALSKDEYKQTYLNYLGRNLVQRYKNVNPDNVDSKIINSVSLDRGLYIFGGVGTGKTYAMQSIYKVLLANNENKILHTVNFVDLLAKMKQTFDNYEDDIDRYITDKSVLLIDDIGSENTTAWSIEQTYRLINYRYENMLLTFFASNLTPTEFATRYGDRIASRVFEMCTPIKIESMIDKRLK